MGNINIAMAAITHAVQAVEDQGRQGAGGWEQHTKDMKKGAEDLIKAAKAGNAKNLKTAANNLNNSCNNCHTDFRDN